MGLILLIGAYVIMMFVGISFLFGLIRDLDLPKWVKIGMIIAIPLWPVIGLIGFLMAFGYFFLNVMNG